MSDSESSSSSGSSSDSSNESEDEAGRPADRHASYKIPKLGKRIWTADQIKNLRKNFRSLNNLDDSIVAGLSFRELAAMEGKKLHSGKFLSEKMAENFEAVRRFPVDIEAGPDHCTGQAHSARFLRGYVGNSQELWL